MTTEEIRNALLKKREIDWGLVAYYGILGAVVLATLWAFTIPPG